MIFHDVVQNTPDWHKVRAAVPTASEIDKIITPATMQLSKQAEGYANKIAAERILGKPIIKFNGNHYTERGHELEPDALKLYEMRFEVDCQHGGFITNDNRTMGCSPDAMISMEKGLELKCPEADTHVGYLCAGVLPNEYKCQVQSSLFASDFKEWDFMSYYPELPPFIITVQPDAEFHEKLGKALIDFEELVQRKIRKIKGE